MPTKDELMAKLHAAGADRGFDEVDTNAYVERHLDQAPGAMTKKRLEVAIDMVVHGPRTEKEEAVAPNTTERAVGEPYRKDLFEFRAVKRPWTQQEADDKTEKMIHIMTKVRELEDEKAEWVKARNEAIRTHRDEVDELHDDLVRGYDESDREVRIARDFKHEVRRIFDVETDKQIDTEPLTLADRELDLIEDLEENERREEAASMNGSAQPAEDEQPEMEAAA